MRGAAYGTRWCQGNGKQTGPFESRGHLRRVGHHRGGFLGEASHSSGERLDLGKPCQSRQRSDRRIHYSPSGYWSQSRCRRSHLRRAMPGCLHRSRPKHRSDALQQEEGAVAPVPGRFDGWHAHLVGFWPKGTFNGNYVSKAKFREMKKFLEELDKAGTGGHLGDRLSSLRQKLLKNRQGNAPGPGPSVHFDPNIQVRTRPGILRDGGKATVKEEPCLISSGSESAPRASRPAKRAKTVGDALQQAVALRAQGDAGSAGLMNRSAVHPFFPGPPLAIEDGAKKRKKKKKKGKCPNRPRRRRRTTAAVDHLQAQTMRAPRRTN